MQARVNNAQIHYELEGPEGAPVVTLSHALAADLKLWEAQIPALGGSFRVLRFDTRGHGGSSAPQGPYTIDMLSRDVVGLLDHLDIARTHFVGISMGGMVAQQLAADFPERIDKLVLCDTTSRVSPDAAPMWEERVLKAENEGMSALAEQTLERWLSEEFRRNQPEATERIRRMIVGTSVAGFVGCCRAISRFDVSGRLSKISAPTLIIVGENDTGTPVSASETIQLGIEGSKMIVLPRALHLTNVETADAFNRELVGFLR